MNLYSMKITIYFSDSLNNEYFVGFKNMELIHSILGKISQHI